MGYLVARTMRTYGSGYREVMSMPIRAFWVMSGFVDRIFADEAKLTLEVAISAQDGETAGALLERLDRQAPSPVKYTGHAILAGAKRDEDATARLAALAG